MSDAASVSRRSFIHCVEAHRPRFVYADELDMTHSSFGIEMQSVESYEEEVGTSFERPRILNMQGEEVRTVMSEYTDGSYDSISESEDE